MFSIADPTLGISWRMGDAGDFRETGFIDTLDPRTRKRMPNPSIELPADAPAATIQVRYVDTNGEMQGPFPIRFDPEAALIRDQRKILDMTATSWLSFREFNGLLVYYTHLVSYRCAIREVRVGIDTAVPDKVLKMPPCDPRDPSVIPHDAQLYLKLAPSTQIGVGGIDLPRRQRVGDQEFSALAWDIRCEGQDLRVVPAQGRYDSECVVAIDFHSAILGWSSPGLPPSLKLRRASTAEPRRSLGVAGTGRPSIPETAAIEPRSRGVLDRPVEPCDDS